MHHGPNMQESVTNIQPSHASSIKFTFQTCTVVVANHSNIFLAQKYKCCLSQGPQINQ